MGTSVASAANGNICLAPSDSAEQTAADVTKLSPTDTLWVGARFEAEDTPIGENPRLFRIVDSKLERLSDLDTIDNLRVEARLYYGGINALANKFRERGQYDDFDLLKISHNFIIQLYRGSYLTLARSVSQLSGLTIRNRIDFCKESSKVISDIKSISDFFEVFTSVAGTAGGDIPHPVILVDVLANPIVALELNNIIARSAAMGLNPSDLSTLLSGVDFSDEPFEEAMN